ncbi:MAG TPA: pentapeptide repeat-containing protein, partial [Pyrinomonadaceae bacterium]|nr:pentapeptide repeat-containing protein [Pyrinomonadaceae bacterium]
ARAQPDNLGAQSVTPKVPDDIQAILKVIGSRDVQSEGNVFEIDLHETNLRGAVMIGHFERVNFIGCDLAETDFTNAQLTSAKLYRANLTLAVFSNANMESADLSQVFATNTKFNGVHFSGAILSNAQIDGSDFTNAQLDGVDLRGATGKGNFFTAAQTKAQMTVNPRWFEDQIIVN